MLATYIHFGRPVIVAGRLQPGWDTIVIQFAFLILVASINFMAGVGLAVYLGKAPRDLRFLAELLEALRRHKLLVRGSGVEADSLAAALDEPSAAQLLPIESPTSKSPDRQPVVKRPSTTESTPVASDAARPGQEPLQPGVTRSSPDAETPLAQDPSMQFALEDVLVDMAAQEVHLRRIAQRATGDAAATLDWEALLLEVNEDIEKLLKHFNEARHMVEQGRELAANGCRTCLGELDAAWRAINQQSMELLVISSEPDPPDTDRQRLVGICESILTACHGVRQSCAAYLAHALLERPMVST